MAAEAQQQRSLAQLVHDLCDALSARRGDDVLSIARDIVNPVECAPQGDEHNALLELLRAKATSEAFPGAFKVRGAVCRVLYHCALAMLRRVDSAVVLSAQKKEAVKHVKGLLLVVQRTEGPEAAKAVQVMYLELVKVILENMSAVTDVKADVLDALRSANPFSPSEVGGSLGVYAADRLLEAVAEKWSERRVCLIMQQQALLLRYVTSLNEGSEDAVTHLTDLVVLLSHLPEDAATVVLVAALLTVHEAVMAALRHGTRSHVLTLVRSERGGVAAMMERKKTLEKRARVQMVGAHVLRSIVDTLQRLAASESSSVVGENLQDMTSSMGWNLRWFSFVPMAKAGVSGLVEGYDAVARELNEYSVALDAVSVTSPLLPSEAFWRHYFGEAETVAWCDLRAALVEQNELDGVDMDAVGACFFYAQNPVTLAAARTPTDDEVVSLAAFIKMSTGGEDETGDERKVLNRVASLAQRRAQALRDARTNDRQQKLVKHALRGIEKILLMGDSGVGKTCLVSRFTKGTFASDSKSTIGAEFATRAAPVHEQETKLQVWDTAGQERYRSSTQAFFRGTSIVIIVYAVTSRKSFKHLRRWIDMLKEHARDGTAVAIAANKVDLTSRKVTREEGEQLAAEHGFLYFEVSAKEDINVTDLFLDSVARVTDPTVDPEDEDRARGIVRLESPPEEELKKKDKSCC